MKYLRKFETEAEYNAFKESESYVTPNVVLVNGAVDYNPAPPPPLYIEAIQDLTVRFGNTYEYSKNNNTWASGTSSTIISANAGEKVYFRASGLTASMSSGIGAFTISTGNCNVGGNIMSMVYGADFDGKTEITQSYQFRGLFRYGSEIVDASKLLLPATKLASYCYSYMFENCTSLVNAPELPATALVNSCYSNMFYDCTSLVNAPTLPATTLSYYCYQHMFYGCSNLQYIKAMFTTTPGTNYTKGWVSGVSPTGTFVKNSAATWADTFDANAIPDGWTVETADK